MENRDGGLVVMKKIWIIAFGSLLLLSGCIELDEKIAVNTDGSGHYEAKYAFSEELTSMLQSGMQEAEIESDLPASQEELQKNFKGEGVKIVSSSFEIVDGRLTCEYRIEFQNATAFFHVSAMRKRFRFYQTQDRLVLESINQNEPAPSAGQPSPKVQPVTQEEASQDMEGMDAAMQAAMAESMKTLMKGLKISIMVELPNEILDSNATVVEGRKANWTLDEEALLASAQSNPFGDHLWASCGLDGLSFQPPHDKTIVPASENPQKDVEPAEIQQPEDSLQSEIEVEPSEHLASESSLVSLPIEDASLDSQSSETVTSGGSSLIVLANGRQMKVDGYYKEGDMLTLRKHGGTFSIPISSVKAVQEARRR